MIDELFDKFDGAFAPNTIRAYRSDFKEYQSWCNDNEVNPLNCTGNEMAKYITDQASNKATSTVRRRIDSLSSVFKLSSTPNPCSSLEVILALKRMYRNNGRHQHQAIPLTKDYLKEMLHVCGNDAKGIRDQVLLILGYETMRRRSELCQFTFNDLQALPQGRYAINLRFSKTDQFGHGKLIPISNDLYEKLLQWQNLVGDNSYILRGVNKGERITPSYTPNSLSRRLKEIQRKACMNLAGDFSGHSFRVGAALDLLTAGYSFEQIMLKGGWKSESTVMRYLRTWGGMPPNNHRRQLILT